MFVHGRSYSDFLNTILPRLSVKIILISHGTTNPEGHYMHKILKNANVVHWFALNIKEPHPKATVLPYGIAEYLEIHFGMFVREDRYVLRM